MPKTARSTQSYNNCLFIIFLLVALVEIENETHGECRGAQICSQIVRFPSIEITVCLKKKSVLLLVVLCFSFRVMTARFYMSVSKSGRNFDRHHGLCEAWCDAGIRFGKGMEFYSM